MPSNKFDDSSVLSREQVISLFERFKSENPVPKTELIATNNYTLLVSVVLSAQATDKSVNKATESLYQKVDTPQKMLELGEEGLIAYIKSIGLYKNKAKNVIALSKILIEKFNSEIPKTREDLMSLPGVGRKTANVILNVVYGEDECRKVAEAIQCCICGKWMTVKEANNAAPYTNGECCSECNVKVVLPHRLGLLNRTKPKED